MTFQQPEDRPGRELIPAPWTLTEREKLLLEGIDLSSYSTRAREVLRQAQTATNGVAGTTEGFKTLLSLFRAKADLGKAINDAREEELRAERLSGEEIELAKLRRENFRLQADITRTRAEADKQARLKEIAIAHKDES